MAKWCQHGITQLFTSKVLLNLFMTAPTEFIEKLLPAIVGFDIVIKEIYGKFKLSQNQSPENRAGTIQGLQEQGHDMAKLIQRPKESF